MGGPLVRSRSDKPGKDVVQAAETLGIPLSSVVDWRVDGDYVTVMNDQGQKFVLEIVRLNPEESESKKAETQAGLAQSKGNLPPQGWLPVPKSRPQGSRKRK